MPAVTRSIFPKSPFCTMLIARRKRSRSLRCCVPMKNTSLGYARHALRIKLVLFERERERLLAEDMLARLQGLDRDLHVPMIGRDNAHDVDVVAVQHLAIVAVDVGLALADFGIVPGLFRMAPVDVAHRHDVAEAVVVVRIAHAHAADADTADNRGDRFSIRWPEPSWSRERTAPRQLPHRT